MTRFQITNAARASGGQYTAEFEVDGRTIGRIERRMTTGFGRNEYRAIVDGKTVAQGRTLKEMQTELREYLSTEWTDARSTW